MYVKSNGDKDDMVVMIVEMLITMLMMMMMMMMMMMTMIMIIVVLVVAVLIVAVLIIIVKLKIIYIIMTIKNMLHKLGIRRPINLLEGHLDSQALICRSQ